MRIPIRLLALGAAFVSAALVTSPAAAFTRADLNGTWIAAEIDDDDVSAKLVVTPEGITMTPLKSGGRAAETETATYLPGESRGAFHVMKAVDGDHELRIFWLFQTSDRALLWTTEDDDIAVAVRVRKMPKEALGDWKVFMPRSRGRISGIQLTADTFTMVEDGETRTGRAFAVAGHTAPIGLVVERRPGEFEWMEVQALPGGGYLVWEHGKDDYVLIYREGARPAWAREPEREKAAAPAPTGSAPTRE